MQCFNLQLLHADSRKAHVETNETKYIEFEEHCMHVFRQWASANSLNTPSPDRDLEPRRLFKEEGKLMGTFNE